MDDKMFPQSIYDSIVDTNSSSKLRQIKWIKDYHQYCPHQCRTQSWFLPSTNVRAIGQRIVEKEQQGKERAEYGTYLIKNLANEIEPEYGSGFGVRQPERCRQFYTIYPISSTLRTQLNWYQYKQLIAIPDPDKREYYELEAVNEGWSGRNTTIAEIAWKKQG